MDERGLRGVLIDAHNHLQDQRLKSHLEEILQEFTRLGVREVVVNGTRPSDWADVAALADRDPRIRPAFGLHPWYVSEAEDNWLEQLESFLPAAGGIGEIGLDRWMRNHNIALQKSAFLKQIELASKYDLPMSLHCLQAWGTLLECLKDSPLPSCGFLLHSFGGPAELLEEFVSLGAYFSLSGYFFNRGKESKLNIFRQVPLERLLLETDAPDMHLPEGSDRYCFKREEERVNHPGNIGSVYDEAAKFLGLSLDELSTHVEANFVRLFGDR